MVRVVQVVYDEYPQRKLWSMYVYLESESIARQLLTERYKRRHIATAERLAYENVTPFIYYLKQAAAYYEAAQTANMMVKPLLLYYGMTTLTKAHVLVLDPHYPNETRVLQHGMSTRKRKKANYELMTDEIKIQKDGLLPHLLRLREMTHCLEEKYTVAQLIGHLPSLYNAYTQNDRTPYLEPIHVLPKTEGHQTLVQCKRTLLDHFHLTPAGFVRLLNRYQRDSNGQFTLIEQQPDCDNLTIAWHHPDVPHVFRSGDGFLNDMIVHDHSYPGHYYIRLSYDDRFSIPETAIHLMLLFQLGMLARYEPERWGELILAFGSDERYLLHELFNTTERYYPNLILNELLDLTVFFRNG